MRITSGGSVLVATTSTTVNSANFGIVLGSDFIHSTDIGSSNSPYVLLSMTFGTDMMNLWEPISKTALSQGNLVSLPNGNFINHSLD